MITFQHMMMFPITTEGEKIDAVLTTIASFAGKPIQTVERGVVRPPCMVDRRMLRVRYIKVEIMLASEDTMDELADLLMDEHGEDGGGVIIRSFTVPFGHHEPSGTDPKVWAQGLRNFWLTNPVDIDDFSRDPDPEYLYVLDNIPPQPDDEPEPAPQPVPRFSKEALLERYSNSVGRTFTRPVVNPARRL